MAIKITHKGYHFCQHCGLSTKECKKMFKQIGEFCCKKCEEEVTGTKEIKTNDKNKDGLSNYAIYHGVKIIKSKETHIQKEKKNENRNK